MLDDLAAGPLFRTRPLADLPQPDYFNTAVVGGCRYAPDELLALLKALELAAGRHAAPRHSPRPLDLDLLVFGPRVSRRPELTLPHPRLRQRRFALAPLAAIAPHLEVPPDGATVAELLSRVGQQGEVEPVGWRRPP